RSQRADSVRHGKREMPFFDKPLGWPRKGLCRNSRQSFWSRRFMNVLVTGGAGFIGSHVAEGMLAAGHRVAIVENESTGKRENVPHGAAYFRADVARAEELEPVFKGALDPGCPVAGQVSIIRSFNDPITDLRTNTEGTVNIIQLCVKYKVPRLIYASSMTNYGHTAALPIPEDHPCAPTSYYGITKYAAERYAQ